MRSEPVGAKIWEESRNVNFISEGGKMERINRVAGLILAVGFLALAPALFAQQPAILGPDDLGKLVPANFYFEGQLAPTQMRNAAGVRFAAQRHFIAALVDTSGYASSIRSKFEGFLICDRPVMIGGTEVKAGAYGFGFAQDMKMNILDMGGMTLHSITAARDDQLQSPRPLAIIQSGKDLRLYRGKSYVVIATK
jgi:hypothetical protein